MGDDGIWAGSSATTARTSRVVSAVILMARQPADEGLKAAGRLNSAHLDPAAGEGAHLNLLPGLHAEVAQQLPAERYLALACTPAPLSGGMPYTRTEAQGP